MSHKLLSRPMSSNGASPDATGDSHSLLVSSFVQMTSGITRPKAAQYVLEDAARGRPIRPLGRYPQVADECEKAGGQYAFIIGPLRVELARIRAKFCKTQQVSLRDALESARKESSEAEAEAFRLALSVSNPDASVLASLVKETHEAVLADEQLIELAEQILYTRQGAK